ncbi:MAG: hypothetical protein ACK5NB_11250 [Flavobacteriaceae bacterium]
MKTTLNMAAIALLFVLNACAPSMNAVWQKENYAARPFKKIAVIAISKNLEYRQEMESAIMTNIKKQYPNVTLVSGLNLFPPNVKASEWEEGKVEALLTQNGIDAVLTTSLIDNYTTQDLDYAGGSYYYPTYHRVGRYMFRTYNGIYASPTYDVSQNYVFQSSLFDLNETGNKENQLIWQGQSSVVDPSSIESASGSYAKNLVGFLVDKNYFKAQ